jgi:hypothetical protein
VTQPPLLKEAAHKTTIAAGNAATKKAGNETIATKEAGSYCGIKEATAIIAFST